MNYEYYFVIQLSLHSRRKIRFLLFKEAQTEVVKGGTNEHNHTGTQKGGATQ